MALASSARMGVGNAQQRPGQRAGACSSVPRREFPLAPVRRRDMLRSAQVLASIDTERQKQSGDAAAVGRAIVVAIDASEVSTMVAPGAYNLASHLPPDEGLQERMARMARSFIDERMHETITEVPKAGPAPAWEVDLVQGGCNTSISEAVLAKCEDLDAAVVVLSVRSSGLLERLFQVDVSEQVARRCKRPTLIYHD